MIRLSKKLASVAVTATVLFSGTALIPLAGTTVQAASDQEAGKKVAFTRSKGNCLACHMIPGGESPGNIAPPLIAMKARYPDVQKLRAQIWDATKANPDSSMPPFGKHGVLSEKEVDQVTQFIWNQ